MLEIEALENEKAGLEKEINDGIEEYELLQEKTSRIGIVISEIDEKSMRWLELDEFVH